MTKLEEYQSTKKLWHEFFAEFKGEPNKFSLLGGQADLAEYLSFFRVKRGIPLSTYPIVGEYSKDLLMSMQDRVVGSYVREGSGSSFYMFLVQKSEREHLLLSLSLGKDHSNDDALSFVVTAIIYADDLSFANEFYKNNKQYELERELDINAGFKVD